MAVLLRQAVRLFLGFLLACGGAAFGQDKLPRVDEKIDPARSYWREHVHYAYPHRFARVEDTQGRSWNIAYLDLFRGDAQAAGQAPVLVLIHGRMMNSGYWGELLDLPLAAGFRVISIDWSNSGKSLPENMAMPLTRTLDDVRRMIFNLVVRHLGIRKACYLGHSLGGQVAAGYALAYPDHVARLVLYAPGGLESFPGAMPRLTGMLANRDLLFNLAYGAGRFPDMGRTEAQVEASFYDNPRSFGRPYLKRGDKLGAYMVATRARALRGHPAERERLLKAYAWDSLAALMECRRDDPQALPNRIAGLKVPTFLALGLEESAFPIRGTGNEDLVRDVVAPLWQRAKSLGSPVRIKLYEKAGHFLHTDLPGVFSHDVLSFLQTGIVPPPHYTGEAGKARP
ncbi:MAG: 2-hydroxy-6-oxononadienedioate/2-hydroxy-6-oxononatrienedioate hydrolase [Betaproteobacteria bacterium ADurb.Bin341]|nr:MAG: 2-hydroxy-6-oxononadienedioate/2-hydroxy-6-oxononatrienedioate hydrolase [Betaproteobacteria bacterium ADurb.Bin341]